MKTQLVVCVSAFAVLFLAVDAQLDASYPSYYQDQAVDFDPLLAQVLKAKALKKLQHRLSHLESVPHKCAKLLSRIQKNNYGLEDQFGFGFPNGQQITPYGQPQAGMVQSFLVPEQTQQFQTVQQPQQFQTVQQPQQFQTVQQPQQCQMIQQPQQFQSIQQVPDQQVQQYQAVQPPQPQISYDQPPPSSRMNVELAYGRPSDGTFVTYSRIPDEGFGPGSFEPQGPQSLPCAGLPQGIKLLETFSNQPQFEQQEIFQQGSAAQFPQRNFG